MVFTPLFFFDSNPDSSADQLVSQPMYEIRGLEL